MPKTFSPPRHPMQPIEYRGGDRLSIRFKRNMIVEYLLYNNGRGERLDLNTLSKKNFSHDDWTQFVQLIGYSVHGFHELPYVSDQDALVATKAAKALTGKTVGCRAIKNMGSLPPPEMSPHLLESSS